MKNIRGQLVCFCLIFFAILLFPKRVAAEATATEGVYIENVNISGMTEEQITQVVNEKLAELQQETIILYVNGTPVSVTAGELGLTYTNPEIVRQALSVGKKGKSTADYVSERID